MKISNPNNNEALSFFTDKINLVQDKIKIVQDKIKIVQDKIFCLRLKSSYLLVKSIRNGFLALDKNICPRQKLFSLGKF